MREILDFTAPPAPADGGSAAPAGPVPSSASGPFPSSASGALDRWSIVNDGVMGGRSTSRVERADGGALRFRGEVSLARGGGFASTRAPVGPLDLSGCRGMALRVRGDGRRYQLRLRMSPPRDRAAYKAEFATEPGTWTEVRLPFDTFRPTFRGRRPPDAPPLDPRDVAQLGFLIADEREGPFQLEVAWIRAYHATD